VGDGGVRDHHPNSDGRVVPTRWVAEQHVNEDLGSIPTMADWLRGMDRQQWMNSRQVMVKRMGSLLDGEPSAPSKADRVSTSDPSGLDSRL